ncbi:hypothetical protein pb186bvf_006224 [Paramecium bursaria]
MYYKCQLNDLDSEDEQFNTSLAYNYFYVTSTGNQTNTTAPLYNFTNNITLFPKKIHKEKTQQGPIDSITQIIAESHQAYRRFHINSRCKYQTKLSYQVFLITDQKLKKVIAENRWKHQLKDRLIHFQVTGILRIQIESLLQDKLLDSNINEFLIINQILQYALQPYIYNCDFQLIDSQSFDPPMNKAIILALVVALTTSQYVSTGFTNTFTSGPLQVSWRTDSANIYFGLVYNASQWFALGVYNNTVANASILADVWIFNLVNNTVVGYDYYLSSLGWQPDANNSLSVTGYAITNTSVSVNFNRPLNTTQSTDIVLTSNNSYSLFYASSAGNVTNTSAPVVNLTQTLSSTTGKTSGAALIGLALVVLAF